MLKEILKQAKTGDLHRLDLGERAIKPKDFERFEEAFKSVDNWILELDLSGNILYHPRFAEVLARILQYTTNKLTTIYLSDTQIGLKDIQVICEALKLRNSRITHLSFSINHVTSDGAEMIARVLQHQNNHLTHLYLYEDIILDKGAIVLAQACLSETCKLTYLNIETNDITDTGLREFLPVIKRSRIKDFPCLLGNEVSGPLRKEILRLLKMKRSKLYSLLLTFCSIKCIPRIGKRSPARYLPSDIIRDRLALITDWNI